MSSPAAQVRSRIPRIAPQIGRAAVERARLTVVPRRRTKAPRMPFVALVSMVLLGGVVGLLLFNTSMQQASFAATALEEQAATLKAREQTLQMELDVLRDPQHVSAAAQAMGMCTGQVPMYLDSRTGKVRGGAADGTAPGCVPVRLNPEPAPKPPVLNPAPIIVQADSRDTSGDTTDETSGSDGADGTHGIKPDRAQQTSR